MFDDDEAKDQADDLGVEAGNAATTVVIRGESPSINQMQLMDQPDTASQRCLLEPGSSLRTTTEGSAFRAPDRSDFNPESGVQWKEVRETAKSLKETFELIREIREIVEVVRVGTPVGTTLKAAEFALGQESTAPWQLDDVPNATTLRQRIVDSQTCLP
jgi:hypothetical protein